MFVTLARFLLILALLLPGAVQADERNDLLALLNAERTRVGLSLLAFDPLLQQAATAHAQDLPRCGTLSHQGCDGSDLLGRLRRIGYPFALAAENIALGTRGPRDTFTAWMNSAGHRENLLRPGLREAGLAIAELNGQALWVLVLGARL